LIDITGQVRREERSIDRLKHVDDVLALRRLTSNPLEDPDREGCQPRIADPIGHDLGGKIAVSGNRITQGDSVRGLSLPGLH